MKKTGMSGGGRKKATIYDLAAESGSSSSTVSAVLNGTWRQRRIGKETAMLIQGIANRKGYTANLQARGLRQARSGLVGLLLPVHDNRFFSSLAQMFEVEARRRGQCPIVVSCYRDPEEERRTTQTLISYSIDALSIAGATDPEGIHDICKAAGVRHVNIDLPGIHAPSVISDNFAGAYRLTRAMIEELAKRGPVSADDFFLFGGRDDHASRERIRGFQAALRDVFKDAQGSGIFPTGYSAAMTERALMSFYAAHGGLPPGLFVNSTINLEGLLRFMARHPPSLFDKMVIGCFDYDPFASFLPFPVFMARQDSGAIIAKAFEIMESANPRLEIHRIMPEIVLPRTALRGPLDALKDPDCPEMPRINPILEDHS